MSQEVPSPQFTAALANEEFILQSAASTTVSEAGSRAALYFSSLSSGLVALGFASGTPAILPTFLFAVLPTVFLLGCFTVVRLIDTSVENLVAIRRIERIRRYWSSLDPAGSRFFRPDEFTTSHRGVRYGRWAVLFTMASMVIVVNAVLAGATTALVCTVALHALAGAGVTAGALVGAVVATVGIAYEDRRLAIARGVVRQDEP